MRVAQFRAMGSPCRIVVDGGPADLADSGEATVHALERSWSRFQGSSEVSQLNRNAGNISIVSDETFTLIERACEARFLTAGRFNPLMLDQLEYLGYDAPWDAPPSSGETREVPGSGMQIKTLPDVNGVILPAGTKFDPGGIGKGLAADLVTEMLINRGATTTSVELGGDLRVSGSAWLEDGWHIDVADPFGRAESLGIFRPESGAVTTSSRLRRRWVCHGVDVHHLLDPETGLPAQTDLVSVTTCSPTAWWAEVSAKTVLMAGSMAGPDLLLRFNTPGVMVTESGETLTVSSCDMERSEVRA